MSFASVILDVDSTLCGVEGIDWLANMHGTRVAEQVADATMRAMAGEIALDAVYGERLALVLPTERDVAALADAYIEMLAPGAQRAVQRLHDAGRRVVLVSGGIREAILPVAVKLGIAHGDVHAVSVQFGANGSYRAFDTRSPLATSTGKFDVAKSLDLPRRVLAVGDGATDLALRPAVDAFAAFTGFATRMQVVDAADVVISSFDQLTELVLA
ncbi:MAG: hypothetical protein JWM95_2272 [Gemmatimonadetes bacterium]|nr:hypothetical protein [Gemmatimonadota bacterium]